MEGEIIRAKYNRDLVGYVRVSSFSRKICTVLSINGFIDGNYINNAGHMCRIVILELNFRRDKNLSIHTHKYIVILKYTYKIARNSRDAKTHVHLPTQCILMQEQPKIEMETVTIDFSSPIKDTSSAPRAFS